MYTITYQSEIFRDIIYFLSFNSSMANLTVYQVCSCLVFLYNKSVHIRETGSGFETCRHSCLLKMQNIQNISLKYAVPILAMMTYPEIK